MTLSGQAVPHLPGVQRERREPGAADHVPEPAEDAHALQRRSARRVPDRRHLLRACEFQN